MASKAASRPMKKTQSLSIFLQHLKNARDRAGTDVENYKLNNSRCRILSNCKEVMHNGSGIIYWMCRDCRVQDNWAMLFAQSLALSRRVPLFVCFFGEPDMHLYPTKRQYEFLIGGFAEIAEECCSLNIKFYFIRSSPTELVHIVKSNNIGAVVCDFFPLRTVTERIDHVKNHLPPSVAFIQVDAHNIVPAWVASEKQEFAARTLRPKLQNKLDKYLVEFPTVTRHKYTGDLDISNYDISLQSALDNYKGFEPSNITWARPGTNSGLETLRNFLINGLKHYELRNNPATEFASNLSPWLHFGHISAQRCALEVKSYSKEYKTNVGSFLEELIIRKELADNYCFYNIANYDKINGAAGWARATLIKHKKDKRPYLYMITQFVQATTHDQIWNAAQTQLVRDGKMHGYMRMYWAKKILEWTLSPECALEMAIHLNDMYSLDGSDPNGYVGIMWSICGVHDRAWQEREVFGKIRYMVDYSICRKYEIDVYVSRFITIDKVNVKQPSPELKLPAEEAAAENQQAAGSSRSQRVRRRM